MYLSTEHNLRLTKIFTKMQNDLGPYDMNYEKVYNTK